MGRKYCNIFVSLTAGILVMKLSQGTNREHLLLPAIIAALIGTSAELFSPSEYDTVTIPAAIAAVLLIL